MLLALVLIVATALTIGGYFVLYLAARSEGGLRSFGKYLGFWAFTLAALVILGALLSATHHRGRFYGPAFGRGAAFGRGPAYGRFRGPRPGGPPFLFRGGPGPRQSLPGPAASPGNSSSAPVPPAR